MKTARDSAEELLVVRAPVANLRRKPVEPRPDYTHDELQETQLLYNEVLLQRGEEGDWYFVEGKEQARFSTQRGWHGYPGWVKKQDVLQVTRSPLPNAVVTVGKAQLLGEPNEGAPVRLFLSFGTRLQIEGAHKEYLRTPLVEGGSAWIHKTSLSTQQEVPGDPSRLRQHIARTARLFAGTPYLWGGRSMFMSHLRGTLTGVDCSGLTNLVYRGSGMDLPRDADDQWRAVDRISPDSLQPADFIFLSKAGRHSSIDHVMLYVGEERIIEAFRSGTTVKEKMLEERFGFSLASLAKRNFIVDGRCIHFGCAKELNKR